MMAGQVNDDDAPRIKPLAATLQEVDRGRLHTQASQQLHELIAACLETGKGGSLTLTLSLKVDAADDRRLTVSGQVTTKLPQPASRTSIFFVDADGNFTRRDPSQLEFDVNPVRSVPAAERAAQ